jgi:hypothetical protein
MSGKFLHISQHWRAQMGSVKNPISHVKRLLSTIEDVEALNVYFGNTWPLYFKIDQKDNLGFGEELYKINDDSSLSFMGSLYDTSD